MAPQTNFDMLCMRHALTLLSKNRPLLGLIFFSIMYAYRKKTYILVALSKLQSAFTIIGYLKLHLLLNCTMMYCSAWKHLFYYCLPFTPIYCLSPMKSVLSLKQLLHVSSFLCPLFWLYFLQCFVWLNATISSWSPCLHFHTCPIILISLQASVI